MNVNSNTCSSSNTTTTKCNKNLGIVVECIENSSVTNTDESQALLLNSGQNSKRKLSDRLEGNTNKMANTNVESTATPTKNDMEEYLNSSKHKKKSLNQQPSRFERGRLGLITFLNNITASPTSSDLDNTSEELFSLSGKLTSSHSENQQKEEKALSVGDVPLNSGKMENSISNEFNKENGNLAENQNSAAPADKLSIKSGVSMAASSNSRCGKIWAKNFLHFNIFSSNRCPECPVSLQISDIYNLLSHQPEMLERFELYSLRRILSIDPDTRWCPAPDCTYAVIATSCAACPQLKCERCTTMFCYHCKNEMKACPRCGALITKMNDGSCNHMQCALCNAEFCWLCLKQINELHYLSPTGCTFWGKKPWTRKKKLLWQIGTLIGAPLGIALIAGLAVPGIICGVPIFIGRKTYQRFSNLSRTKRQLATALSVVGSLVVSPVLAVMTVGLVSLTDKPNTEDASIQAIAGSQYNYDNRSVHTIWSSGCHVGVIESVHGVNINGEDAENASTMACCSASIAAQASERRSLTGSNSSFKTRPRSSISNSRGVSEEPGKIPAKFTRKVSVKNVEGINGVREIGGGGGSSVDERIRQEIFLPPSSSSNPGGPSNITFNNNDLEQKKKSRFSLRSFVRHPINTIMVNIGLLIIRGNTNNVKRKLQRLLELAASKVTQKLYVHLEESDSFEELLPAIYLSAACIKSEVDFRVLLDRKTVQVDKVFYDKIKDPDQPPFPIFNEVKLNFSTKFNLIKAPFDFIEKPFRHVVLGGAFDKLHNGHKLLLSEAVFRSTKITCGVTDGDMIK
uniref:RBR-type E3 ubiquitin transferase n=1 Tax=Meloidogyne javanica TaxID=6303 RepID=A0A915M899_MELJA